MSKQLGSLYVCDRTNCFEQAFTKFEPDERQDGFDPPLSKKNAPLPEDWGEHNGKHFCPRCNRQYEGWLNE